MFLDVNFSLPNLEELIGIIIEFFGGVVEVAEALFTNFADVYAYLSGCIALLGSIVISVPPLLSAVFLAMVYVSVVFVVIKLVLL